MHSEKVDPIIAFLTMRARLERFEIFEVPMEFSFTSAWRFRSKMPERLSDLWSPPLGVVGGLHIFLERELAKYGF